MSDHPLPVPTMAKPFSCRDCGEMIFSPNVEAFDVLDVMICDDCANDALGDVFDDDEGP